MDSFPQRHYSAISEHSSVKGTPKTIREWLISLQQGFRASPSVLPESEKAQATNETCGLQRSKLSAWYDLDLHSWKTYQVCLIPGTFQPSSLTWPKAGMMQGGVFYRLPKWERRINETGSGFWPTPTAGDSNRGVTKPDGKRGQSLVGAAKGQVWPTPKGSPSGPDYARMNRPKSGGDDLATSLARESTKGGQLNPRWVEWLMGWPIGWASLKPLETGRFHQWLEQHGNY